MKSGVRVFTRKLKHQVLSVKFVPHQMLVAGDSLHMLFLELPKYLSKFKFICLFWLYFLDVRDAASSSLADLLSANQLTKSAVLLDHIIPAITSDQCSQEEIINTMLSVIHNLKSYM